MSIKSDVPLIIWMYCKNSKEIIDPKQTKYQIVPSLKSSNQSQQILALNEIAQSASGK